MVMCSALSVPMSTSGAMTAYRLMIRRVAAMSDCGMWSGDESGCDGAGAVGSLMQLGPRLSPEGRTRALKRNADLLVSLRAAVFFEEKKKGLEQVSEPDENRFRTMNSRSNPFLG